MPGAKAGQPASAAVDKAASAAGMAAAVAAAALMEALAAASSQAAAQVMSSASKHVALLATSNATQWLLLCRCGTSGQNQEMICQGLLSTSTVLSWLCCTGLDADCWARGGLWLLGLLQELGCMRTCACCTLPAPSLSGASEAPDLAAAPDQQCFTAQAHLYAMCLCAAVMPGSCDTFRPDTAQVAGPEVASAIQSLLPVTFEAPRPDSAASAAPSAAGQPSAAQLPPAAKAGSAGAQAAAHAPAAAADAAGSPSGRPPVNWAAKVRQPELQAGLVRVLAAAAQHEGPRSALAPAAAGPGDGGAAGLLSMLFNMLEAETPKLPELPADEAPAAAGWSLLCTCRSPLGHNCG